MICVDLERIYKERHVPNKYILTLLISERARQLSEREGTGLGYDEKFITSAMNEVLDGKVDFKVTPLGAGTESVSEG